jgi:hypothetical protein
MHLALRFRDTPYGGGRQTVHNCRIILAPIYA